MAFTEVARAYASSAAASPPAADGPVTAPPSGVGPGQAVEGRAVCPPPGSPAHTRCKRCGSDHDRTGDLCRGCVADDLSINGLHGAYAQMRVLLGYADLLNDCPEGRVYLALVENGIRSALTYGRKLEAGS